MSLIKVLCKNCKLERQIYIFAKTNINCVICNTLLATPKGGKIKLIDVVFGKGNN